MAKWYCRIFSWCAQSYFQKDRCTVFFGGLQMGGGQTSLLDKGVAARGVPRRLGEALPATGARATDAAPRPLAKACQCWETSTMELIMVSMIKNAISSCAPDHHHLRRTARHSGWPVGRCEQCRPAMGNKRRQLADNTYKRQWARWCGSQ